MWHSQLVTHTTARYKRKKAPFFLNTIFEEKLDPLFRISCIRGLDIGKVQRVYGGESYVQKAKVVVYNESLIKYMCWRMRKIYNIEKGSRMLFLLSKVIEVLLRKRMC